MSKTTDTTRSFTPPFGELLAHLQDCAGGCPYCVELCQRVTTEASGAASGGRVKADTGWLIWSNEHEAWWGPDSAGYRGFVHEAGRYSLEEADKICRNAGTLNRMGRRDDTVPAEVMVPSPELVARISLALEPDSAAEEAGRVLAEAVSELSGHMRCRVGCPANSGEACRCGLEAIHVAIMDKVNAHPLASQLVKDAERKP